MKNQGTMLGPHPAQGCLVLARPSNHSYHTWPTFTQRGVCACRRGHSTCGSCGSTIGGGSLVGVA
jgi:hypothetical protein